MMSTEGSMTMCSSPASRASRSVPGPASAWEATRTVSPGAAAAGVTVASEAGKAAPSAAVAVMGVMVRTARDPKSAMHPSGFVCSSEVHPSDEHWILGRAARTRRGPPGRSSPGRSRCRSAPGRCRGARVSSVFGWRSSGTRRDSRRGLPTGGRHEGGGRVRRCAGLAVSCSPERSCLHRATPARRCSASSRDRSSSQSTAETIAVLGGW